MMSWHVAALCVVAAGLLWLCAVSRGALGSTNSSSSCIEAFQCFDAEFPGCSNDTTAIADQPIQVLIGSREGALLDIDVQDFSQLLTQLVCHHLNRSTTPPLCWVFSQSMNVTSECNRTLVEVGVHEMFEDGSLSPALSRDSLLQLLRSSSSFFALAGYTLTAIEGAVSIESSPAVPLASWILVALGIISSLILLTQPIWWNRIIVKCRQHCQQNKNNNYIL